MESKCEFICHRVTGRRHKGLGRSQQSRDQHVQEGSRRRGSVLRHLLQEFKGQRRSNIQGEKKKSFNCFPWIFQTLYIQFFWNVSNEWLAYYMHCVFWFTWNLFQYILSSGKDSLVKLWELSTNRCLIVYTGAGMTGKMQHGAQAVFNHTEDYSQYTSWQPTFVMIGI